MAYIEPNTRIDFLSGVPFDPGYENTMYFDDLNAQVAYFDTKISITVEKSSYQRVNKGVIKVGWAVDTYGESVINQMYNVNYMRFKNTNFENKWFYAFVDKVEYINNNTVEVRYHLDVMQTWHFDYSFNQCMIERQHTVTDNIGAHTLPEDFELGDYVIDTPTEFTYEPCAIVVTAGDFGGTYGDGVVVPGLQTKGDWFSGVHFYPFPLHVQQQVDALNDMLEAAYTDRDKLNTIIAVFVMPNTFASTPVSPQEYSESIITPGTTGYHLGNYPVRNAKLMNYPYNMLYVTNYQGDHLELHFEYFTDPTNIKLKIWGNLSANPGMILYPVNYKMTGDNFDEMLQITGFPMCAWANDAFKAWVAQNAGTLYATASTIAMQGALGIGKAVAGYNSRNVRMTESGGSQVIGALSAASLMVGKVADHYVAPPSSHGNGNGNIQFQAGKMTFMWCHKHIRGEYASIIDDFFDMYGYAVHESGIPNRNARPCYTYVKTADCSMDGNVPVDDLRLIEQIFNKGVRFWRLNAAFGVYDVAVNNNAPIN